MERPLVDNRPRALSGTLGEAIAEFLGTLVLVLLGDGTVATYALFMNAGPGGTATPSANQWIIIVFGWTFAVMFGIYIAGAISGAHINPAVTIAFAARGKLPWSKVAPYIVAQVLGAFVAAAIVYLVYQGAIGHYIVTTTPRGAPLPNVADAVGTVFYTAPKPFVGLFGAFCDEVIGTALLVGLIFALVDRRNQPVQANLNPLIIGLVVGAVGASFGLNTGFAINPARDFGPRLWIALVSGGASLNAYTWVPIVAPIVGGLIGAFIYEFSIGRILDARNAKESGSAVSRGETLREPAVDQHSV